MRWRAQGALTLYSPISGAIHCWDPLSGLWTSLGNMVPGQNGAYHVVSAYSAKKNCLVAGAGNGGSNLSSLIYRMNSDRTTTRMPDAPRPVGIYHGMNLVSDHTSGNFLCLGFGQLWELNPDGAGTWKQLTAMRAPPAVYLTRLTAQVETA